jgi:SAM-dependent methyltransferase
MLGSGRIRKIKEHSQELAYRALRLNEIEERKKKSELAIAMGFIGQFDEHRRFQMDFLKSEGLHPNAHFLEIGCGPLTLGVPLIDYLYASKYTGVDVRNNVLDIAYGQISENRLSSKNPRLIHSNAFGADAINGEKFDIIWAFSVLFHLTDDLVERLLREAFFKLSPQGVFWANINSTVGNSDTRWNEFPFMRREPAFYEEIAAREGLSMHSRGTLEELGFRLPGEERRNIMLEFKRRR